MRIFSFEPDCTVTLKKLPNTDSPEFDAVVLLIYGIQAQRNLLHPLFEDIDIHELRELSKRKELSKPKASYDHPATASSLILSAQRSGLQIDRIDRILYSDSAKNKGNLIFRGGAKKGTTYALTIPGRQYAIELLRELLDILDE